MKTLIAYVTKGGATEEVANAIADVFASKGIDADLLNLKKEKPNLDNYNTLVLGAGVRAGKIYGEAIDLLKKNDLQGKKLALFIVSGEANDPKTIGNVFEKHIKGNLMKHANAEVISYNAFGGRMKFLWKEVFNDLNRLPNAKKWAEELADKLA